MHAFSDWSVEDVVAWLSLNAFAKYAPAFEGWFPLFVSSL
jgi:hypothetical protein